jgi:hypothetical protein
MHAMVVNEPYDVYTVCVQSLTTLSNQNNQPINC